MPNDGEAGKAACAKCGLPLGAKYDANGGDNRDQQDKHSTWKVFPKKGIAVGTHYYCGWVALMEDLVVLGRKLNGGV
jgi:hypothetical protein